jgi:putative tricarboxylic transport membrane protein
MEILSLLGDGMLLALQPLNLMLILIGVTVGSSSAPCRGSAP